MKRAATVVWVMAVMLFLGLVLNVATARAEGERASREAARKAREEQREKAKERARANREKVADNRQERQDKRIQHGINKGYLTPDEVKKLEAQQDSIAALEASFKADGRLTRNEFKQLQTALNEASRCIWSEKHDTDGNQMQVYRLGKNVFARDVLTGKLADENLSAAAAQALLKDFHRTVELKRKLSTDDLSADERATLQAEYDTLLNKYFEMR